MTTEYIDLLLDNGEIVRISYNDKFMDEFTEHLDNCIKRKDRWSTQTYDGTTAEYMGIALDSVNTSKVVGLL